MSLDFKLILDEFNRRFDELEIRWDRRFSLAAYIDLLPTSLSINHPDASASAPPTPVVVIADNWGGCFDDDEQYRTRPSVVVDNWGGFFCGEDVAPSDNPTRFVLPVASTDEPSIDTTPARANSGAADDSVFVTAKPSGYDEMDARLDLRFARLQQLQAEEVDEPYRDAVSPLPPLPVIYEPYREAIHPPPVHDDVAGVVSTGSDDDLDLQQIAKELSVSSSPRHSSRDAVRGPCPRPLLQNIPSSITTLSAASTHPPTPVCAPSATDWATTTSSMDVPDDTPTKCLMRVINRGDYYSPDASSAVDMAVVLLADAGCMLLVPPHHPLTLPSSHSFAARLSRKLSAGGDASSPSAPTQRLLEGLTAFATSSPMRLRQMLLPTAPHALSHARALLSFLHSTAHSSTYREGTRSPLLHLYQVMLICYVFPPNFKGH
jgi:hypothetical protein